MKRRIFTSLLTIVFAFSMFTTAFANEDIENVTENIVTIYEETINEDNIDIPEEVADVEKTVESDDTLDNLLSDEPENNEEVQVYTIPILRDKEESFNQEISLMSLNTASLMSTNNRPVITGAYSQDFYADSDTFEIELYIDNMSDTRQKLKLAVVDENDAVIAQQTGVYYHQNGLKYQMKLVKSVDAYSDYYIQFSYNGKHGELDYEIYDASIYPITDIEIKNVEVINYATNSFRIELANATVGTKYTLFYEEEWDGASVKKDATVTSDKSLYVEFGDSFAFSNYNYIWLCPYGSTYFSYSNYIDYKALYNFDFEEAGGEISNNGVNCNSYISTNDTTTWFGMWEKGFGGQRYNSSDVSKVNVYMFDMTTGKTVGTMTEVEYMEEYDQIDGYITFNTKLDETHKYIMVFNDGYSIRVDDSFVLTSEKKLIGLNPYDSSKEYLEALPAGTTTFYAYASSINISDRNNIKVELLDGSGKTVATSTYESKSHYHLMTTTTALSAGEYTLKATYGSLVFSKPVTVVVGSSSAWQLAFDETAFNGKTYIGAALQTTTLNPANLTYKVVLADGTEKTASYHRALFTEGDSKYFVIVLNEELTGINYENKAKLKMYNGSNLIAPTYDNNVSISSVGKTTEPFIYNEYKITDTAVELFLEGFSNVGTFTLCGYDELTQTGVTVNAAKSSNTSITFNKSDLKKINSICPFSSDYGGYSSSELFIESNGEYLTYIWASPYDGLINAVLDDAFCFQRAFTGRTYEVLNLPYNTYAYYKLATSESELASKSYQKIDVGLLYQLKNQQGKQTVYAQFKTSGGVESEVQTASITIDTQAPIYSILSTIPSTFVIDEYNEFEVSISVNASESGQIHFNFYDADNNKIGYDATTSVSSGTTNARRTFWADDYNYEDATKLVIYMTDNAGNKAAEQSFDISVVREYTEYTSGETYLKLHNETGTIVEAESTGTTIYIPSEIDGVAVTAIGEYAFIDNGEELRISIPESVTSIDEYAFDDLYDFTLLVKENSAAYRFALANDIAYELVTYKKGDILTDGAVNSKDAVKLAQYLAKWEITLTSDEQQAADVFADGAINSKDAVKLAQYLAKWEITLD